MSELLRVENLVKHFPVRGWFGRRTGAVQAVDGVSFAPANAALVGVGCSVDTGRLVLASKGKVWFGRTRSPGRQRARSALQITQDPTPAQSAHMGQTLDEPLMLRLARAAARVAKSPSWASRRSTRPPSHEFSSIGIARDRQPAHRVRRAGIGARRLDPGSSRQPAARPATRPRPVVSVHRPRPRRGQAHRDSRGGHVPRAHRGAGRQARALRAPAASVHAGAALRDSGARAGIAPHAHGAAGRRAQRHRSAVGVLVPHALPVCASVARSRIRRSRSAMRCPPLRARDRAARRARPRCTRCLATRGWRSSRPPAARSIDCIPQQRRGAP